MGSPRTNLAARLLAFAPSTEVVDALLPAAQIVNEDQVPMAAAPSTRLGTKQAGRGVRYAASVAGAPVHDPALLAKLATAPQKTVRRLVAANPDTPEAALEKLAAWALKEPDGPTIDALCGTLDPTGWLPRIAHLRDGRDYSDSDSYNYRANPLPVDLVVAQLERRADRALTLDTFDLELPTLRRGIIAAAAARRLPVQAAELLATVPAGAHHSLLQAVLREDDAVIDDPVADAVVSWLAADPRMSKKYAATIRSAHRLPPHALAAFATSGIGMLEEAAARSVAKELAVIDDDLLAVLARTQDPAAADVLLREPGLRTRLRVDQLVEVAGHTAPNTRAAKQTLVEYGPQLPPEARVNLLRKGSAELTVAWLTGTLPVTPSAAELADLAGDQGQALASTRHNAYGMPTVMVHNGNTPVTSVADLVFRFAEAFTTEVAATPGVDVVLDQAGVTTLTQAALRLSGFTAYLAGRITDRFGDNPQAWELAARMGPDMLTGTVSEFIDLLAGMLGMPERTPLPGEATDGTPVATTQPEPEPAAPAAVTEEPAQPAESEAAVPEPELEPGSLGDEDRPEPQAAAEQVLDPVAAPAQPAAETAAATIAADVAGEQAVTAALEDLDPVEEPAQPTGETDADTTTVEEAAVTEALEVLTQAAFANAPSGTPVQLTLC